MIAVLDGWGRARSVIGIAVIVAAIGTKSFWLPLLSLDEQSNVVYGAQVLVGRMPHRDFFATYGPANYWMIGAAFELFGASVESQRVVGLMYHFTLGVAVYLCSVRRGTGVALAAAATAVLILMPLGSISYAWLAGLSLVLFSLAMLQRAESAATFGLAGVVGASCGWWRPEMLAIAGLVALPFLAPVSRRRLSYVLGFGATLLAMAWYTAIAGTEWLTNVGTRLGVDAGYDRVELYAVAGAAFIAALGVGMVVCGIKRGERMCFSIAILVLLTLPQFVQRPDLAHLTFVACATVPLSVAHILPPSDRPLQVDPRSSRLLRLELDAWVVGALVITLAVGVMGVLERVRSDVVHVRVGDRSIIADERSAPLVRATVDSLTDASSGAPVFVGAEDMSRPTLTWAMFYFLLPSSSVRAYYLEIPPGLDHTQTARLGQDVLAARAVLLTPFSDANRQLLFPEIEPIPDDADRAIEDFFCPSKNTPYGRVFIRCVSAS